MDELDMLRAFQRQFSEPDQAAEDDAWSRVQAELQREPSSLKAPPRRHWPRVVAFAACLTAILVLVGVILPREGGGPTTAQARLLELADVSQHQPPLVIPDQGWLYTRVEQLAISEPTNLSTDAVYRFQARSVLETWQAADGSGLQITTYLDAHLLTPADEQAWEDAGSPELVPAEPHVERFAPGTFKQIDLSSAPTDPEQLEQMIQDGKIGEAPPGDFATFDLVGELLSEQLAPPAVRSALFQVAATLPGVEDVGEIDDPLGRPGIGIRYSQGVRSTTLVFDPSTSFLLAELLERPVGATTMTSWDAFQPASVTDSLPHP